MRFSIKNVSSIVSTLYKLGVFNILQVMIYRIQCKTGYFQHILPTDYKQVVGRFFDAVALKKIKGISPERYLAQAEKYLNGENLFFFNQQHICGSPPVWLYNSYTQNTWNNQKIHWSKLKYFSVPGEDIKVIWELSRFYWAPQLACAYQLSENKVYLNTLNDWVLDWTMKNPVNQGVQWLCAQEASIRMINLLLAHFILGNQQLSPTLQEFIINHCQRIAPTMHYARAQQNNHATSEAAGLYIGSAFLLKQASLTKKQENSVKLWLKKGKEALEKNVAQLVMSDGSFSQYSVTYHRLMLDTLSLSIHIQRHFQLPEFSKPFLLKYELAFKWLYAFIDKISFDAPNLGSNDGTALFDISLASYRDFRPSLQLASLLLYKGRCFQDSQSCNVAEWLGLPMGDMIMLEEGSHEYMEGGFIKFYSQHSWALLRYPVYHFRPSQCDAMHFDLWIQGINVLCDSGTYSYNPAAGKSHDFSSVKSHNTIQIDDHDQMRKFSRFLYMGWLKGQVIQLLCENNNQIIWCGESRDAWGSIHKRKVIYSNNRWEIEDIIKNIKENVILRWHLADIAWSLDQNICHSALCEISICEEKNKVLLNLEKTEISPNYLKTNPCYCLTASVSAINNGSVVLKTIISIHGVN